MCAGSVIEISSNEELTQLIEKIHHEVFGMTFIEREL